MKILAAFALLLAAVGTLPAHAEDAAAPVVPLAHSVTPGLTPYQAIYKVSLVGEMSGSSIVAAEGRYYADFSMTCAGNGSQAKLLVTLTNREGGKANITNETGIWEAADGLSMQFSTSMRNQRQLMREIKGSARLEAVGGKGTAEIEANGAAVRHVELPAGTIFPLALSARLLLAALADETALKATVFDGQTGGDGLAEMVVAIAAAQPLSEATKLLVGAGEAKVWPISMTRLLPGAAAGTPPVSDGSFNIISNGLTESMRFLVGEALLEMRLERIEVLDRPVCQRAPVP